MDQYFLSDDIQSKNYLNKYFLFYQAIRKTYPLLLVFQTMS